MKELSSNHEQLTLGARGRVVIPASLRKRLGWQEGDKLVAALSDKGTIEIACFDTELKRMRGILKDKQRSLADELLKERRLEAKKQK